jgi:3-hydroxybutyrate dehydrogenase
MGRTLWRREHKPRKNMLALSKRRDLMNLKGRNAVVTGSTSGIGLGIARAPAQEGANVMLNGFGEEAAIEKERLNLAREFSVEALYDRADMSKPHEITAMIEKAKAKLGSVDILVNNAGIQFVSPVEDFPDEKWEAIIRINLIAVFHATKAVLSGMKARKWGRIINTGSAHSLVASPFKSAYVAAKHGVAGFTKTVALEAASFGVTVNCISPGYVWTELVERQIPDTMKARDMTKQEVIDEVLLKAQPTKQFVTVDQVASLALYLCSDAASQITGANLSIDGGWTAQ